MTTIKLKSGSGAPLASDLVAGEPALDLTNKRLYTENASGTVIEVGTNPTSLTTGTFTSTGIDDNATSTAITIDSSQNVGIGTTGASIIGAGYTQLQVNGSTSGIIDLLASDTLKIRISADGNLPTISARVQGEPLRFSTTPSGGSASERVRIDSSGNVGIGTTSPSNYGRFVVQGAGGSNSGRLVLDGYASSGYTCKIGPNDDGIGYYSNNNTRGHVFYTGTAGTERMRIDSNGNVGIGTTSPSPVAGTGKTVHLVNNFNNPALRLQRTGSYTGDYSLVVGGFSNNTLRFVNESNVAEMTLTNGNLLVGKTSASYSLEGFHVGATSPGVGHFTANDTEPLVLRRNTGTGSASIVRFYREGTATGVINVASGATPSFASSSDIRLKDNVTDHESELSNVMSLRPVRWNWKDKDRGVGEGFVAQELEQTAWADLVSEGDDGYKQVSGLGTVETRLIKALQEAVTRIETLEAEVAALKGA